MAAKKFVWIAPLLSVLIGCASYPVNAPLEQYRPDYGYRFSQYFPSLRDDDTFVILTFSGGGTRAAALAYGVLLELDKTKTASGRSLLDEVDIISSVSGGSFLAMHYALHGKEGLPWFEENFLRTNLQRKLGVAFWRNVPRLMSPHFSRADLAAEVYDREVFHGKTFADVAKLHRRPFVIVNAAEIDIGTRFEFTQEQFDRICSDLQSFHVARAVAASSAVPVLFTPIRLRSYAGKCGYVEPPWIAEALTRYSTQPMQYRAAWERHSYLDPQRQALHLLDGGVADNLGVRTAIRALTSEEGEFSILPSIRANKVRRVAVIVVNAGHDSAVGLGVGEKIAGVTAVMPKVAGNMMKVYTFETLALIHKIAEDVKPANVYLASVGLQGVQDPKEREFFDAMPTTFSLSKEQIDALIAIGPRLLKESEGYRALLREFGALVADDSRGGNGQHESEQRHTQPDRE